MSPNADTPGPSGAAIDVAPDDVAPLDVAPRDVSSIVDPAAFAALICDWCLEVEAGQQVLVESTTLAQELVVALHDALLQRGAWPLLRMDPAGIQSHFFANARDLHLDGFAPLELIQYQNVDASLRISAPHAANPLAGVDPSLMSRFAAARSPLLEADIRRRWALTLWPTPALAELAEMQLGAYAEFVARALFLDQPDAVAAWEALSARQARVVQWLSGARELRIQSDRTDLRLNVAGRKWINSDGRRNMPSGEVFTSPVEDSAQGTIYFDLPSSNRGTPVSGVQLTFERGELVGAEAEVGDAALQAALATDGGTRRLGEIGIGTNTGIDRVTGSTLLDEKMAGTVHLALGRSYPEAGGTNKSALHWDLICDLRKGGSLSVDGEELVLDGALRV